MNDLDQLSARSCAAVGITPSTSLTPSAQITPNTLQKLIYLVKQSRSLTCHESVQCRHPICTALTFVTSPTNGGSEGLYKPMTASCTLRLYRLQGVSAKVSCSVSLSWLLPTSPSCASSALLVSKLQTSSASTSRSSACVLISHSAGGQPPAVVSSEQVHA